jgi:hypothetical protein
MSARCWPAQKPAPHALGPSKYRRRSGARTAVEYTVVEIAWIVERKEERSVMSRKSRNRKGRRRFWKRMGARRG